MRRLGVHGFGTEQRNLESILRYFSLHMSLNQLSFDVYDTPCKVDGGREQNNVVMCNCYVICSGK